MIRYEEIIEELDDNKVKDMLDKLNIPYDDKGAFMIMPTVCHHAEVDSEPQEAAQCRVALIMHYELLIMNYKIWEEHLNIAKLRN